MNTEQILKVLKNERECIEHNHDYCYEDCDESCPYYVSEKDKLEVYDHLIKIFEHEAIYIQCDVSEEEMREIFLQLQRAGFSLHPDLIEKYESKGDTD